MHPTTRSIFSLQVPETFDAVSYQQALRAIHDELDDVALSEEKLELVLQLAHALAALIKASLVRAVVAGCWIDLLFDMLCWHTFRCCGRASKIVDFPQTNVLPNPANITNAVCRTILNICISI